MNDLSTQYRPGTVTNALHVLSHLTLKAPYEESILIPSSQMKTLKFRPVKGLVMLKDKKD